MSDAASALQQFIERKQRRHGAAAAPVLRERKTKVEVYAKAPLYKRLSDVVYIAFFLANLVLVNYIYDLQVLLISNPSGSFSVPSFLPADAVRSNIEYAREHEPLAFQRPLWYRITCLLHLVLCAPYYAAASYAFVVGAVWIRKPTIYYAIFALCVYTSRVVAGLWGPYASESPFSVVFNYWTYLLLPAILLVRALRASDGTMFHGHSALSRAMTNAAAFVGLDPTPLPGPPRKQAAAAPTAAAAAPAASSGAKVNQRKANRR